MKALRLPAWKPGAVLEEVGAVRAGHSALHLMHEFEAVDAASRHLSALRGTAR